MGFLGAVGSAIGSFLGSNAGAATISGLFNSRDVDKTNQANKDIAEMNLGFQRENLDYQKALQEKIFEREDSSYARTVQDMRNAGLSPLSMQNTNGAGEVIATTAPEMNYQRQRKDYSWISQATQGAIDNAFRYLSLKKENEMADAQIQNVKADTVAKLANNDFFNLTAGYRLRNLELSNSHLQSQIESTNQSANHTRLQSIMQDYLNQDYQTQNSWNKYFGLSSDMSALERGFAIALKSLGLDFKNLKRDDFDKVIDLFKTFSNDSSAFILNEVLPLVSDSEKKDIYGNSGFDYDQKILDKVKRGEKLTSLESIIYWFMKNGIK